MRKWNIHGTTMEEVISTDMIIEELLKIRHIVTEEDKELFFHPTDPTELTSDDVHIEKDAVNKFIARVQKAILENESIVIYADYDADGITAGAILWEALYVLGAKVMPYIPHRKEEGYGFSEKGLTAVKNEFNPTLIISVDHGITAGSLIPYAKSLGMEIIVSDHHLKPETPPECLTVHTTMLSGSGISFFLANHLLKAFNKPKKIAEEFLSLAAIGTIADMVPLIGPNRSIVKFGLKELNKTKRVGLIALMENAGISPGTIKAYNVSHMIAPRLNAMGRLTHALDALRLLCTKNKNRAEELAILLGSTNKERQQMTTESVSHAKNAVVQIHGDVLTEHILIISHESYDQGIIGLVAGRLMEEHYRPVIVLSIGDIVSKASARSIPGFNIVDAIRSFQDLLIDVGGHPLAAGFTIETKNIPEFQDKIEEYARIHISPDLFMRTIDVDCEISINAITDELINALEDFEPYGLGNSEPIFVTKQMQLQDIRLIGAEKKHMKLKFITRRKDKQVIDAIAFNQSKHYEALKHNAYIDCVYTIEMNEWNGMKKIQMNIKDIHLTQ
jgi:single-stranded-DNA-specific exonuclease